MEVYFFTCLKVLGLVRLYLLLLRLRQRTSMLPASYIQRSPAPAPEQDMLTSMRHWGILRMVRCTRTRRTLLILKAEMNIFIKAEFLEPALLGAVTAWAFGFGGPGTASALATR